MLKNLNKAHLPKIEIHFCEYYYAQLINFYEFFEFQKFLEKILEKHRKCSCFFFLNFQKENSNF